MSLDKRSSSRNFAVFSLDSGNRLRSKRSRSCEFCQKRKVKCLSVANQNGTSCEFCVKKGVRCSLGDDAFESSAPVLDKQRESTGQRLRNSPPIITIEQDKVPKDPMTIPFADQLNSVDWLSFINESINNDYFLDLTTINTSPGLNKYSDDISEMSPSNLLSLNQRSKHVSFMHHGYYGEYDPWLRYHFYQYDQNNECFFKAKFFRKLGTEEDPIIFSFKSKDKLLAETKVMDSSVGSLSDKQSLYDNLAKFTPNFIVLYLKFIFPALPIFDGDFLHEIFSNETSEYNQNKDHLDLHLLLLVAKVVRRWETYDTSIDMFTDYSDSIFDNRKPFFTEVWRLLVDEIHTPDLSTVKSLILFYHILGFKKDSQSNGFEKSILSIMVSVSYTLGLHMDCSDWNIPKQEKNKRHRIWWTVYLLEKWGSFVSGNPSLINDQEHNVRVPDDFSDLFDDVTLYLNNQDGYINSFRMSLELTFILNDVKLALFGLSSTGTDKERLLSSCDQFETKLDEWRDSFNSLKYSQSTPTNSLLLSSYTINILLFRARFKILGVSEYQSRFLNKAKRLLTVVIDFIIESPITDINRFWYRWSRSLFMYIKDFILSLIVLSKTKEQSLEVLNLTRMFREWLELNSKHLNILWTALLRLNTATQSIGTQFKENASRRQ